MAIRSQLDELLKNETARGVALGLGVAALVLAALPAVASVGRPLARAAIKSGLLLIERGREAIAEAGEELEDLVAEVRAELVAEKGGLEAAGVAEAEEAAEAAEDAVSGTSAG